MSRGTLPKGKEETKKNDVKVYESSEQKEKRVQKANKNYLDLKEDIPKEKKSPIVEQTIVEQPIAPKKTEENQAKVYVSILLDATLSMAEIYPAVYEKICMDIEYIFKKYKNVYWRVVLVYENHLPESTKGKLLQDSKLLILAEGKEEAKSLQEKLHDFQFTGGSEDGYETNLLPALKKEAECIDGIDKECGDKAIIMLITDSMPPENEDEERIISSKKVDSAYLYFYKDIKAGVIGQQCKVKTIESYIKSQQCDLEF